MNKHLCLLAALLLSAVCNAGEPEGSPTAAKLGMAEAVTLGVVEGVTEYLPISSTGHLILTERALGIGDTPEEKIAADAYAMVIQFGAILAVVGLYRARVKSMILGVFGRDPAGLRLAVNLFLALLPAAAAGLFVNDFVRQHLFGLWPVVSAWFVGGVAILLLERFSKRGRDDGSDIEGLTPARAFGIGCFQCLAMWPGVSRSLSTMLGGRLLGLNTRASVEFSFLLGGLTLTASAAKDTLEHGREILDFFGPAFILVGLAAAFVSAVIAVKWLVGFLNRHSLSVFGWYRIALAAVVAGLLASGHLSP